MDNINLFIENGAIAVGAGGSLVNKKLIENNDYEGLTEKAKQFMEKVSNI